MMTKRVRVSPLQLRAPRESDGTRTDAALQQDTGESAAIYVLAVDFKRTAAMVLAHALARRCVARLGNSSRALSTAASSSPPRVTSVKDLAEQRAVCVTWEDEFSAKFHKKWLRDHCTCIACLHPDTRQRQVDTASIPADPKMTSLDISQDKNGVAIQWLGSVRGTTCTASEFSAQWLRDHAYGVEPRAYPKNHRQQTLRGKELWEGSTLQLPRRAFADVIDDIRPVMEDLHRYGLAMVHSTPSSMDETERFSRKIGFVMETIYGKMWTTNPQNQDQEYNDTASTNLELLHHTDGTYIHDPPGLQIFNCIAQAGEGGASRYIDSFHLVETLRRENRAAFDFFSTTPLHYFTYDQDAHLATMEPLIKLDHAGNVMQFRHNDYDRAPLTHLSFDQVDQFYRYHEELLRLMRDPKMEFRVRLGVGDMILVDNHRVMHGRDAFDGGERALIGCYIGHTEYESRLRVLGII